MKKRVPLTNLFSSRVVRNYSEGWRNTRSPDARFSDRTLKNYAASIASPTFAIAAAEKDAPTEILLYDEIGYWGVTDKDFALALAQAGNGPIKLRINSPGGDVFHGYAIYNMLVAHPAAVEVVIDGLAASAASFIAMAGTTISMAETSMLMIHNAWGIVVGDRNDMLETAAVMEKIDGQLAAIYASKSGKAAPDVTAMMDAETWFTSSEAKTAGLCDAVLALPQKTTNNAVRLKIENRVRVLAEKAKAALPAYDPDGDGDNDAEEALGMINAAAVLLGEAIESLTGVADEDDATAGAGSDAVAADGGLIIPGASAADEAAGTAQAEAAAAETANASAKAARERRLRLAAAA
jgi:ATP-dependent Clp protease protease subunit